MLKIGIIGSGAMGAGIAQVAAMAGHEVKVYDKDGAAQQKALGEIQFSINKLVSKDKMSVQEGVASLGRVYMIEELKTLSDCDLIIEAIIENLEIKKTVFKSLEKIVSQDCILATNTSSLSITSIAGSLEKPERCIGIHFFNPPVLMKLVEVIPAIQTSKTVTKLITDIVFSWGKTVVLAKDTPGFIVNKVARPFYSEAIRILEEGIADIQTIDLAMTSHGFRMGPFTLMDYIGHDVNYKVTESVWKSFYYDSKYRPSFTQLRLMEAGFLGRKSGRGFYNYKDEESLSANQDQTLLDSIFDRIISMLINEACDTVNQNICSVEDVDLAMTLGVNYPKGLLALGKEIGFERIIRVLKDLGQKYGEERYRISPYLQNLAKF